MPNALSLSGKKNSTLTIATRGSTLALWQANFVKEALKCSMLGAYRGTYRPPFHIRKRIYHIFFEASCAPFASDDSFA